jgi:sucrose-6-phosphate hydrolase SacC (GH32 family)
MRILFIALIIMGGITVSDLHAEDVSKAGREKLYHESLRPQFHFTARYWDDYQLNPPNHQEGWLNDLNGLVYNDGEYHLFAQRWWSAWLHAVSTDLIHWQELRPAFGKGGRFGGTQSGGGVVDINNCSGLGDGKEPPMIAFWSSTDNENQCISYSLDKGRTWTKYDKNPVLVQKYRDPKVFWYEPDKTWIMVLYGPSNEPGRVFRYGFNGEENDAHTMRDFTAGQWTCSAIRMFKDGKVVATDQYGKNEAKIDADKQNTGAEIFCVGAKADGSEFLDGDIAEVLVYNRSLSDEETKITLADLQSKWGMGGSNTGGSIPTDGLVLHLDAADAAVDTEGLVSSWKDISGHRSDVTQSAADSKPKRIAGEQGLGGRPVVRFNGRQYLQGPAVLSEGNDAFTIIALWRREYVNGSQVVCEQNAGTRQVGRRASLLTVRSEQADNVYLLFSSTTLLDWKKLDGSIPDSFECPDMFILPVDGDTKQTKWVVIDGNGDYVLGRFDGRQFTTETKKQKGDYGRNFYATMTFENMPKSDPRRIQLAWMRGWDDYPKNMPFNQQVTFPCELTLRKLPQGIVMCRYPIREISTIYGEEFLLRDHILKPGENPLSVLKGDLFDINMVVDISQSRCSEIVLSLCGNTVKYDVNRKILHSVGSEVQLDPRAGLIEIRVLMDRLSIESFGNQGEVSITNIAYQKAGRPPLEINAVGGEARVVSLTVHKLNSIWK